MPLGSPNWRCRRNGAKALYSPRPGVSTGCSHQLTASLFNSSTPLPLPSHWAFSRRAKNLHPFHVFCLPVVRHRSARAAALTADRHLGEPW